MTENGIGAAVRRKEDHRFITGKGQYVDDINRPNQLYAIIVRSPQAHAKINSIASDSAKAAPGVVAVFTGADMAAAGVGGLPCGWGITSSDGTPMVEPGHPPLAVDVVHHVGDQVAVVLAETRAAARDAAELVEVDYEDLPAVASLGAAGAEARRWSGTMPRVTFVSTGRSAMRQQQTPPSPRRHMLPAST